MRHLDDEVSVDGRKRRGGKTRRPRQTQNPSEQISSDGRNNETRDERNHKGHRHRKNSEDDPVHWAKRADLALRRDREPVAEQIGPERKFSGLQRFGQEIFQRIVEMPDVGKPVIRSHEHVFHVC